MIRPEDPKHKQIRLNMKRKMHDSKGRRAFIRKTAIGAGGAILAPTILPYCVSETAPSDKLSIAHIGVGSRGSLSRSTKSNVPLPPPKR